MVAKTDRETLLQRTLELCRQLTDGRSEQAESELPSLDAQLLDAVTRPLIILAEQTGQLRAGGDAGLLQPLRGLKHTAEHSLQLLRSIPMLAVSGPHIRLHPDSILARFTTLQDLAADLPELESQLRQIHAAGNQQQRQQAVLRLQAGLTAVNSKLKTI